MTPVTVAFGANLKRLRLEAALKQAEVAAKAGISPSVIVSAEQGACGIRLENGVKIAKALGVSLDEMVTDEPEASHVTATGPAWKTAAIAWAAGCVLLGAGSYVLAWWLAKGRTR